MTWMPFMSASSSLTSMIASCGARSISGRKPRSSPMACEVTDDGVHDAVRVLDDRGHVLLAVGLGGDRTWRRTGGSPAARPTSSRAAPCRVAASRPPRNASAQALWQPMAAGEHERGDLGVVEEPPELQAFGDEAARRVEDDGHPAVGRQLGHLGLQREKLAAHELAAEQERRSCSGCRSRRA